ncbi:hypothetical protein SVIO_011710 [Streptomyces violaceusniger]|uniref:Uncharacterized protein n=1 Tax=Streptomyces violaceusniger TaxID=68280 RepID=A0A4D4KVZ8_STRVO|nr:hypothetical protein SVIO_011710 [Streptomyces violaceusniger]
MVIVLLGLAVLGAAILVQKRVVDTGWDPGAARDALMPRESAVAPAEPGTTTAAYAKIPPPAGAPAPPPAP